MAFFLAVAGKFQAIQEINKRVASDKRGRITEWSSSRGSVDKLLALIQTFHLQQTISKRLRIRNYSAKSRIKVQFQRMCFDYSPVRSHLPLQTSESSSPPKSGWPLDGQRGGGGGKRPPKPRDKVSSQLGRRTSRYWYGIPAVGVNIYRSASEREKRGGRCARVERRLAVLGSAEAQESLGKFEGDGWVWSCCNLLRNRKTEGKEGWGGVLLSFDPPRNALLLFYSACASRSEVETQTAEPSLQASRKRSEGNLRTGDNPRRTSTKGRHWHLTDPVFYNLRHLSLAVLLGYKVIIIRRKKNKKTN